MCFIIIIFIASTNIAVSLSTFAKNSSKRRIVHEWVRHINVHNTKPLNAFTNCRNIDTLHSVHCLLLGAHSALNPHIASIFEICFVHWSVRARHLNEGCVYANKVPKRTDEKQIIHSALRVCVVCAVSLTHMHNHCAVIAQTAIVNARLVVHYATHTGAFLIALVSFRRDHKFIFDNERRRLNFTFNKNFERSGRRRHRAQQ